MMVEDKSKIMQFNCRNEQKAHSQGNVYFVQTRRVCDEAHPKVRTEKVKNFTFDIPPKSKNMQTIRVESADQTIHGHMIFTLKANDAKDL